MRRIIITKGLPGCGKSTWAKEFISQNPSYRRINKDDIRNSMMPSFNLKYEDKVIKIRNLLIDHFLSNGLNVIVDDTNLNPKHINFITENFNHRAVIEIKDFSGCTIEECIKRDLKRENSVGEKVIRDMYNKYIRVIQEYKPLSIEAENAIIVDLDGTLAINNGRSPYAWGRVDEDGINVNIAKIVDDYKGKVILVSGRDSICREETINWLNKYNIKCDSLFMRQENDSRKDSVVKKEIFDTYIRDRYYIDFVLDDRLQVCRMWHELGLTILRVGDPDLDF